MIKEEMDKLKKEQAKQNAWNYLGDLLEKAKEQDPTVTIETLRVRNNSAIPMMTIIGQAGTELVMGAIKNHGTSMNHRKKFPFDDPTVKTTLFHQCIACGWCDCVAKLLEYDPGLTAVADSKDDTPEDYLDGMLEYNWENIGDTIQAYQRSPGESLRGHWANLYKERAPLLVMHEYCEAAKKRVAKQEAEADEEKPCKKLKLS